MTTYSWDGENRMVEAACLAGGVVDTFTFNADGQRVGKTDQAGPVKYVWDRHNVLIEANASNAIQAVHTLQACVLRQPGVATAFGSDVLLPLRRAGLNAPAHGFYRDSPQQLPVSRLWRTADLERDHREPVSIRGTEGLYLR